MARLVSCLQVSITANVETFITDLSFSYLNVATVTMSANRRCRRVSGK